MFRNQHHTHTQTPLHIAARKGYAKCLQILLEYGARMDIETTHREKPLQLVQGKFRACEKVFEHVIAKFQIPRRSHQQEAIVNGVCVCVCVCFRICKSERAREIEI